MSTLPVSVVNGHRTSPRPALPPMSRAPFINWSAHLPDDVRVTATPGRVHLNVANVERAMTRAEAAALIDEIAEGIKRAES